MSLFARWADDLRRLRDEGRFRALRLPAGIDFTSNDYLGYGRQADLLPASCASPAGWRLAYCAGIIHSGRRWKRRSRPGMARKRRS